MGQKIMNTNKKKEDVDGKKGRVEMDSLQHPSKPNMKGVTRA